MSSHVFMILTDLKIQLRPFWVETRVGRGSSLVVALSLFCSFALTPSLLFSSLPLLFLLSSMILTHDMRRSVSMSVVRSTIDRRWPYGRVLKFFCPFVLSVRHVTPLLHQSRRRLHWTSCVSSIFAPKLAARKCMKSRALILAPLGCMVAVAPECLLLARWIPTWVCLEQFSMMRVATITTTPVPLKM